jgi:hypothetical protein
VPIPVQRARRIPFDDEIAERSRGDRFAVLIDESRLITGHHDAARSRAHAAGLIRDEDVQDFR